MAHALWATATGRRSAAPAFVADSTHDGRTVFRYAMPDGAPGELQAGSMPKYRFAGSLLSTCHCAGILGLPEQHAQARQHVLVIQWAEVNCRCA